MEPFLSMISLWAPNFAPRQWAFCGGQLLSVQQNQALYALLGTTYGGDGQSSFGLPDLRGRAPLGAGQGPGLSNYTQGSRGGTEQVTLTTDTIPAHQHAPGDLTITLRANTEKGNSPTAEGARTLASLFVPDLITPDPAVYNEEIPDIRLRGAQLSGSLNNTGASQPHENRQPYLVINYIISLFGLFPSRS